MTGSKGHKVVGADGSMVEVNPMDPWPLPYRGSRYTLKQVEGHIRVVWAWQDYVLPSTSYPARVVKLMAEAGKMRGSLCVTAHGDLITKVQSDDGSWKPVYLGQYEDDFKFPKVNNNPSGLRMGEHWTGFPFHHGERWSVSPREGRGELMWKLSERWFRSTKLFPDLALQYKRIRSTGGRLYVNEYGHLWMNVPDGELSDAYADEFKLLQSQQLDALSTDHNDVVLKLIAARISEYSVRPVYLGNISSLCSGEAPWTFFTSKERKGFGKGSEAALDDGDTDGQD